MNFKVFFNLCIISAVAFFSLNSCEDVLFEPKLEDEQPVLISPTDNTKTFEENIKFIWRAIDSTSQYQFQIATPGFDNPEFILTDKLTDSTSINNDLEIGKYQWRVRGVFGNSFSKFATHSIEIIKNPSFEFKTVALNSPTNNATVNTTKNTVTWQKITEATGYEIQLLNTAGEAQQTFTTSENRFELTFPENESSWRVRAEQDGKFTAYSQFKLNVDSKAPNTPTLSAPEDNTTVTEGEISFAWTRETVEGTVEIDSLYLYNDEMLTDLKLKQEATSPIGIMLEKGTFYWNVKAFDAAGNMGTTSNTFSVIVN